MSLIKATDASFSTDVLSKKGVVLVDFWAEWCGPCRMIDPILKEMAAEMEGQITIAKVNIDENPHTPASYGVRSIPTLLLFKNGEQIGSKVGVQPKSSLISWIQSQL